MKFHTTVIELCVFNKKEKYIEEKHGQNGIILAKSGILVKDLVHILVF